MGKPQLRNLQIDKLVTSFVRKHENHEFVADRIFEPRLHNKTEGVYYTFDRSHQTMPDEDLTLLVESGWKTPAREVEYDLSSGSFSLKLRKLKEVIGQDQIRDAGSPIDAVEEAAINVREKLMLAKELKCFNFIDNTGNYASGNKVTLANSLNWDNYGTGTGQNGPIVQVQSGTLVLDQKVGPGMTKLVVGPRSHNALLRHPDVTESIKYVQRVSKSNAQQAFADLFGVDEYLVMKAIRNAVRAGGTASMTFVASDMATILRQPNRQRLKQVAFGVQFQSESMPAGTRRNDPERSNAVIVEVMDEYTFESVDTSAGYHIDNTIA